MKIKISTFIFESSTRIRRTSASGFTLTETIVAILITGMMVPTVFVGFASAFSGMQAQRENLRATQIMMQRMEAIRLAGYNTLQDPVAYPATSTDYYSPSSKTGAPYTITYNCVPGPLTLPPSYRTNMMLVTVTASWKSGSMQHTRSMQSYVAKYGIQRLVSAN